MAVAVWQSLYGSRCMAVTVWQSLYGSHCMAVTVLQSLYCSHCMAVTVPKIARQLMWPRENGKIRHGMLQLRQAAATCTTQPTRNTHARHPCSTHVATHIQHRLHHTCNMQAARHGAARLSGRLAVPRRAALTRGMQFACRAHAA